MKEVTKDDVALEASLLKAMSIRKNFDQFIDVIDIKRLIPVTSGLLQDYRKYYESYPEQSELDWELFYTEFTQKWHRKDFDEQDIIYYRETVFPLIQNASVGDNMYIALLEREASEKIIQVLDKGFNYVDVTTILESLKSKKQVYLKDNDGEIFKLGGLDLSILDTSNGLPWFLPQLQAGLHSLMPGQFYIIAADSDTGKSAFCISQTVHVFKHLNRLKSTNPIIYATSEDTQEDLGCRFLSCLYRDKCPGGFEEIIQNFERVSKSYLQHYNDELFIGMPIRGAQDLIKLRNKIDRYEPRLVVIDMLDKLSPSDNIQDLTKVYQEIRAIANDGVPVIGTSQTGNTSYQDSQTKEYKHRKWLTDKDLAGSKSGKQGAAYGMIMIGKDDSMPNIRYITTTKKKRGQHVSLTCEIQQQYSLYKELI